MVYCGKPSKGCLACRSRKTRCDRQEPACSQCTRAKRQCPGYRNQLDLMFRNESDAVIGKATTLKTRKSKSSSSTSSATPRASTPVRKTVVTSPKRESRAHEYFLPLLNNQIDVPGSLSPSLQDRALSFYRNREAIWLRNFDMVESICNQANTEEYLLATLSAVGLASYARSVRSPKLLLRARRDYGQALLLTNAALKSPVKYTNDSTLFAVMALGVFEAVAGNGRESLDAWNKHLAGASELVKLRGATQFFSDAGQRMFMQINSNLIFQCITAGVSMPEHVLALRKASEPFIDTTDTGWRISEEIIKFASLRASVIQKKGYNPHEVVRKVLEMDATFADIIDKRPEHWRGKIIRDNSAPEAIWNGHYVVYRDFWVAQMLNTMRVFRIHTLEILREQLQADNQHLVFSLEEAANLEQNAVTTMLEMQAQILASLPQYAPWGVKSYPSTSPIEPWHAYQVLWPLYLAANMDITSREISQWAFHRFQAIAAEGGIEHAAVFSQAMMKRLQLNSDGSSTEGLARPLKMDPFDWRSEGWAIVHATILSAQINKPKTPPTSPKAGGGAIPPGWKGGPPPGWQGGPPPGWTGGPPPGWTGGPPPGWKGGLPPGVNSGTVPMAHPPDARGPPSKGWSTGTSLPPTSTRDENTFGFEAASMQSMMSQIPAGWTGPPPPGWKPGMSGPPIPSRSSDKNTQKSASTPSMESMMSQIPAEWSGPPPPGWRPGMPGPPTSSKGNNPTSTGHPPVSMQSMMSQIPAGWSGPPPKGWKPGMSGPPSSSSPPTAHQTSRNTEINSMQSMMSQIPAGWSGPPPKGWKPTSPDAVQPQNAGENSPHNHAGPPDLGPNGIPRGWTGPPPPGWKPPPSFGKM